MDLKKAVDKLTYVLVTLAFIMLIIMAMIKATDGKEFLVCVGATPSKVPHGYQVVWVDCDVKHKRRL